VAAFFVSQALMSIAMGAILLVGLLFLPEFLKTCKVQPLLKYVSIVMAAFLLLHLLSLLHSDNQTEALRKISLKLPLFLSPLLWIPLSKLQLKQLQYIFLVFLYFVYITGAVSVIIYLKNKVYFDELILQAKPIPLFFGYGIYHIQFSLLNAIAALVGLYQLVFYTKTLPKWSFYLTLSFTIGSILSLHILSARTGILSFYVGLMSVILYVLLKKGNRKIAVRYLLILLVLPVVSILFSDSLKNRIINTQEDLHTIVNKENPNDKSIAMRVEAWKTGIFLIKQNPLWGVGLGDLEEEMQAAYLLNKTLLSDFNRKNPHNQFIETGVHMGLPGTLILFLLFVVLCYHLRRNPLSLGVLICWLSSFFFESMLERQVSVFAFSYFLFFFFWLETSMQNNLAHKLEETSHS
jgi:O-antigen ligase